MEAVRKRSDVLVSDAVDVWTQVTLSLRSQLAESVWFSTFQDERIQVCACGVYRSRQACATGADNDHLLHELIPSH